MTQPGQLAENGHVAFVRTPRYLWPFNSAASAFWPPLGFCSLAGAVRERFSALRLSILDCPALKIGWKTLERKLRADPADVVCIGEETVSSPEGLRLARLVKGIRPQAIVVGGGVYFSYRVEKTFAEGTFDYIVRGEGEQTLAELIQALLQGGGDFRRVDGLAYREGGRVCINPPRAPIRDPDSLPRPAYDLLQVDVYGRDSKNHPALATLEHGRGCTGQCSFCILWKHFGEPQNGGTVPCYRTKSPERTFDEVKWLATQYGRRTIHFVDPCFNTDPGWTDRFTDLMLAADLDVQFTAWMRADGVVRDERLGIMEKLVRAGLVQAYIGIERAEERDLAFLDKRRNGPEITRRAFQILRERHPSVFAIGTIIYGLPWESKQTLAALRDIHYAYPIDCAFYIPLAPNPGTEIRRKLEADGYRMSDNFREYNFFTPVMDTDHLSRRQLEDFYSHMLLHFSAAKLRSILRATRNGRDARAKRVYRHLLWYAFKVGGRQLLRRLLRPLTNGPTLYAKKPKWYDG